MSLDDYKVVLYRNQPDGWVAEIPALHGCFALMSTREEALAELPNVFAMIVEEYEERRERLPAGTNEIPTVRDQVDSFNARVRTGQE